MSVFFVSFSDWFNLDILKKFKLKIADRFFVSRISAFVKRAILEIISLVFEIDIKNLKKSFQNSTLEVMEGSNLQINENWISQ